MKNDIAVKTIDDYLSLQTLQDREMLSRIRKAIGEVAKDATEGISYQIPVFKYHGMLVGFAAFKNHCSFFPMSAALIGNFKKELAGFKTLKGTIQFTKDNQIPIALIKKMVKIRMKDNLIKSGKKQKSLSKLKG